MTKKYFQDRTILMLSGIIGFVAVFTALYVILKIDNSKSSAIIAYRPVLGLQGAFVQGSKLDLYAFSIISLVAAIGSGFLAKRFFHIRRSYGLVVLALGLVFLIFNLRVAIAVLAIR